MTIDWRKLGLFLAGVGGLYIILVGVAADFAQVLSLKHSVRLLVLLLVAALAYKAWKLGIRFWHNYCDLQSKLDEARDFIMRSAGRSSSTVLLCARTLWLFQQYEQSIPASLRSVHYGLLSRLIRAFGHKIVNADTILAKAEGKKCQR